MAKKKSRPHATSRGLRANVSTARCSGAKQYTDKFDRALNKQAAYAEGKTDPKITIPNPDPTQTNRRFIRVSARSIYGDPKKRDYFVAK